MLRALALAGGLLGAAVVSQFPEFTQQYTQRLAGQVEALGVVIADFDASAQKAEMTREEALASMGGSVFLENRRRDMRETIDRHGRLSDDLTVLRAATPLERLTMPQRVADTKLARATFDDFRPALPLTLEGGISALAGYAAGWAALSGLLALLLWPFRRSKTRAGLTF
ncbi:DUF2937 family protein [Celeribacter ethanolicus]|uniref:DUF2937 domain-containing protein n=1 Tax=Celeribacter ethanolicus TaxID=1758178 RepID=A0A291GGM8_9RHOB|nr:DUF2937 family protein [Celeribacter ethanolicus]ATG49529.1 hypothetical protein CEW89_19290 [Celeribacter ethanolicus]